MRVDMIRKIALLTCLVFPMVMTHAAHADNVGSGPPLLPKALNPPEQPIVAATSDGYLPASWDVTPTGAFTYTIPLKVPDGRAAMQPSLSLSYSSNGGNGLMGIGWSVSGLSSITRCGRTLASNGRVDGVNFSTSDRFCLDGQRLVAIGGVDAGSGEYGDIDTEYRTEADTFARIISTGPDTLDGKGPQEFIVYTKNSHIQKYKAVEAKRLATYMDGSVSVEGEVRAMWLLSSEEDRLGNMVRYEYTIAQGNGPAAEGYALDVRPYHISYTSNLGQGVSAYRYVEFVYEGRPDNEMGWQSGILHSTPARLQSIGMYAPNPTIISKVWQYNFGYAPSAETNRSLLTSVQQCAAVGGCAWAKQFDWAASSATPEFVAQPARSAPLEGVPHDPVEWWEEPAVQVMDLNGDGADDLLYHTGSKYWDWDVPNHALLASRDPFAAGEMVPLSDGPYTIERKDPDPNTDYGSIRLESSHAVDIDGDGQVELFAAHFTEGTFSTPDNCAWRTERWRGTGFRRDWPIVACELVDINSNPPKFDYPKINFADLDGDGLMDMIRAANVDPPALESYTPEWFIRFNNPGSPGVLGLEQGTGLSAQCDARVTDIDGDGRGDLLARAPGMVGAQLSPCSTKGAALRMTDAGNLSVKLASQGSATQYLFPAVSPAGRFGDFNGDGLEDYLSVPSSVPSSVTGGRDNSNDPSRIIWNTGNGFHPDSHTVVVPVDLHPEQANGVDTKFADKGVRIADINRDGRADIVSFHNSPSPTITLLLSRGDGTFQQVDMVVTPGTRLDTKRIQWATSGPLYGVWPDAAGSFAGLAPGWNLAQVGDFNGDGFPDLIRHAGGVSGGFEVLQQTPHFGDRLKSVSDENTLWARESITYSTEWSDAPLHKSDYTCAYPLRCVRSGPIVVRSLTSKAHMVDPLIPSVDGRTLYYAYEDPVSDLRGNGFLGFGEFRIWDPSRPIETKITYDQRSSAVDGKYYPYAGIPQTVTTVVPILTQAEADAQPFFANARITKTVNYGIEVRLLNGDKSYAVLPGYSYTKEWEESVTITWDNTFSIQDPFHLHVWMYQEPVTALRATNSVSVFDDYGNLTARFQQTEGGVEEWTSTPYDNRAADWLIGLPISETVTRAEYGGSAPPVTRSVEYHHNALGQLDEILEEHGNANPDVQVSTTLGYNSYGLLTSRTTTARNEEPRVSHIEYARLYPGVPDEQVYVSEVWSEHPSVACVGDCRPARWTVVHPAYGVPVAMMDVNGVMTQSTYDGLGRLRSVLKDGEPTTSFSYSGRVDAFGGLNGMIATATAGLPTAKVVTNATGSTLSTLITGFDGSPIKSTRVYDRLGRMIAESRPFQSVSNGSAVYFYDSLTRLRRETLPDGNTVVYDYPTMFETHISEPSTNLGTNESYVINDVNGRPIVSAHWLVGSGVPPVTKAVATSYEYAPFDLVSSVTDDQGHVTHLEYDLSGRRTAITEPDRGTTTTAYNGFDEVREEVHLATGQTKTYVHDDLGRVTSEVSPDGKTRFIWDLSANGVGQLALMVSPDEIQTAYRYDGLGRVAGIDLTDELSAQYSVDMTYTANGQLETLAYPVAPGRERFTAQYHYNAARFLDEIGDATPLKPYQPLWQATARNADLALIDDTLGDGVAALHRDYDGPTGRLLDIKATHSGTSLFHLGYDYWPNGLVKSRSGNDAAKQRNEVFDYDSLRRLTRWTLSSGAPKEPPSAVAVATEYAYDYIGNLTDITKSGAIVEHRTYGHSGNQPHTLSDLHTLASNVHTGYEYDDLGRLNSGGGRSIDVYTSFDLPKAISKGSSTWEFLYDAMGQRIKKYGPDGVTLYVPGLYELRQNGAPREHVFYVEGTDGPVAEVHYDGATTKVLYPLRDPLGSVNEVLDASGAAVDRDYYDPFGQRIEADGSLFSGAVGSVTQGFTGQEHDDALGLINFQGRMYDPTMKRFLTPDPVVASPGFSQSWNPYSYVMNSRATRQGWSEGIEDAMTS